MLELSCPNCGAPVPFQSKVSIYGVCPSCKTLTLQKINLSKILEKRENWYLIFLRFKLELPAKPKTESLLEL
ncbi:hypothetical protein LEP1GSC170_2780 [Leptospira interrogans serovar Bataviae str. HAI135]|nr:hypothetical protein LEP1GSC170_2780 [Leptospira interrogans serovar Bataviae str. HAI135]